MSFDQIRRRSLGGAGQAGGRPRPVGARPRPLVCRGRFLRPRASRARGSRAAAGSQARGDPAGRCGAAVEGRPLTGSAAVGGAPGSAVGVGFYSVPAAPVPSKPADGRKNGAGRVFVLRGEGTGRTSPRSRPEERPFDVLGVPSGAGETQLSGERALPLDPRLRARPGAQRHGLRARHEQPGQDRARGPELSQRAAAARWADGGRGSAEGPGGRAAFSRSGPRRREAVWLISPVRCSVSPGVSAGPHQNHRTLSAILLAVNSLLEM